MIRVFRFPSSLPSREGQLHPGFLVPAVLGILLLLGFLALPVAWMVRTSIDTAPGGLPWKHYLRALTSPFQLNAFRNSLAISLSCTLAGLGAGFAVSAALHRLGPRARDAFATLAGMTGNFSGVPLAFAAIILLGGNGVLPLLFRSLGLPWDFDLYTWQGLGLVYLYFQLPLAVLLLLPAFRALRPEWREQARILGAGPWRYWGTVALPVLAPAVAGTAGILFANSLGAYATAYALTGSNYGLVPLRIGSLIAGDVTLDPGLGSALGVLLTLLTGLALSLNQVLRSRLERRHA